MHHKLLGRSGLRAWRLELTDLLYQVIVFLFSFAAGLAQAQDYPTKPIRLVIPFAAGNTGDISFRMIAPILEARLGQRFIIDNKAGASGNIGAQEVARAAPDGYTLLLGATSIFVVNQFISKTIDLDPLTAFVPITLISDAPSLVIVNPELPVSSLRELQRYAKNRPGKLNFSSPGSGTMPHLAGELFANLAGIDIVHVPFKGSPAAALALLSNDVQIYFSVLSAVEGNLRSGKVKALAVASSKRLAALPDLPTTSESGFPELLTGTWWGLAAPKGTDSKIIDRIAREVRAALSSPEMLNRFVERSMLPGGESQVEFAARIQLEAARWKKVIETIGLRPE